jgi:hypothetical protein
MKTCTGEAFAIGAVLRGEIEIRLEPFGDRSFTLECKCENGHQVALDVIFDASENAVFSPEIAYGDDLLYMLKHPKSVAGMQEWTGGERPSLKRHAMACPECAERRFVALPFPRCSVCRARPEQN